MLRGAVVIFSGLLSVGFLRSTITIRQWIGIASVFIGLLIVGVGDMLSSGSTGHATDIITGDLLILMAQVIVAIQVVVEEYFIKGYEVRSIHYNYSFVRFT